MGRFFAKLLCNLLHIASLESLLYDFPRLVIFWCAYWKVNNSLDNISTFLNFPETCKWLSTSILCSMFLLKNKSKILQQSWAVPYNVFHNQKHFWNYKVICQREFLVSLHLASYKWFAITNSVHHEMQLSSDSSLPLILCYKTSRISCFIFRNSYEVSPRFLLLYSDH